MTSRSISSASARSAASAFSRISSGVMAMGLLFAGEGRVRLAGGVADRRLLGGGLHDLLERGHRLLVALRAEVLDGLHPVRWLGVGRRHLPHEGQRALVVEGIERAERHLASPA